jgi:hypothetical protein
MDRYILLSVLFTAATARFNQEQIPIQDIADVQGGAPGMLFLPARACKH